MPRINNPKPPKRAPKIDNRRTKKKPCSFCQHGVGTVDYKDLAQLRKYISDRGKIRGRKVSGNCQQHQPPSWKPPRPPSSWTTPARPPLS